MMRYDPWNRCDVCGKFIPLADFASGRATRKLDCPGAYCKESYETLCKDHSIPSTEGTDAASAANETERAR